MVYPPHTPRLKDFLSWRGKRNLPKIIVVGKYLGSDSAVSDGGDPGVFFIQFLDLSETPPTWGRPMWHRVVFSG